ncbi:hypothetical protein DFH09DRAFT_1351406 [Mycena vulgaris]|nr:hypothetical protein DFH09DRAFT_1351406 [Mycena vulgaris]
MRGVGVFVPAHLLTRGDHVFQSLLLTTTISQQLQAFYDPDEENPCQAAPLPLLRLSDHAIECPGLRRSFLPMFDPQAVRVLELGFHELDTEWLTDDIAPPHAFPPTYPAF